MNHFELQKNIRIQNMNYMFYLWTVLNYLKWFTIMDNIMYTILWTVVNIKINPKKRFFWGYIHLKFLMNYMFYLWTVLNYLKWFTIMDNIMYTILWTVVNIKINLKKRFFWGYIHLKFLKKVFKRFQLDFSKNKNCVNHCEPLWIFQNMYCVNKKKIPHMWTIVNQKNW